MLFRGQSYRSLDAKGRLMLPPEFRDALTAASADGTFVLTTYDGCLVGYPGPLWNELEERFGRLRNSSRKIRDFRRLVLGGAEDQSFDAQGRIRLSRAHMEYAGLGHDAVVVGQGDKFEIWDQARFKALLSQDFDDVADELAAAAGLVIPKAVEEIRTAPIRHDRECAVDEMEETVKNILGIS